MSCAKLSERRKACGLTQTQLAEAAGVNVQVLRFYEQGYKDINKAAAITVYRIAQALRCSVEDLLNLPPEI